MSTDKQEKAELIVAEGQDGSAVVDMPENMLPEDDFEVTEAEKEPAEAKAEGGAVADEDADHPDDGEELRAAKRNRRRAKKDLIRKTNEEKDIRLQQLSRENEEFKRRLANVEDRTRQNDMARLDKGIEDSQVRYEYAKMKLSEAVSNNDGNAMVEAQELFEQARQEISQLQQYKNQAAREAQQPRQQKREVNMPDPSVQRNAADWMNRNSWYNPEATDRDSRIAKKMDEVLVEEGWDPKDPDYWDELDSRLHKSLPHRYNVATDNNPVVRKPRNTVASSGREASTAFGGSNRTQFTISPERVKAMKEAGAWDNPERKKAMIANFMKYDRENAGRRN
jgi:hypothetical protein